LYKFWNLEFYKWQLLANFVATNVYQAILSLASSYAACRPPPSPRPSKGLHATHTINWCFVRLFGRWNCRSVIYTMWASINKLTHSLCCEFLNFCRKSQYRAGVLNNTMGLLVLCGWKTKQNKYKQVTLVLFYYWNNQGLRYLSYLTLYTIMCESLP